MPTDDMILELQAIPGSEFTCRVPLRLPGELYRALEAHYDPAVNVDGGGCAMCRDAAERCGKPDQPLSLLCGHCRFVSALWDAGLPDSDIAGTCQCVHLLPCSAGAAMTSAGRRKALRSPAEDAAMRDALDVLHSIARPAESE